MRKKHWIVPLVWLSGFVLWTVAVGCVDVAPIGPHGSSVGFATFNDWFHRLTGVHMDLYILTDWLGLVPVAVCIVFAILGLSQWMRRKSLALVDVDILLLGGFYAITIAAYLLFESMVINYRPVIIAGYLEASYPSSTTLLTLCVMLTTMKQICRRIQKKIWRRSVLAVLIGFTAFMVVGRWVSGVHWCTDVVGGVLLSLGLVSLYDAVCHYVEKR